MNAQVEVLEEAAVYLEGILPLTITIGGVSTSVTTNQSPIWRAAPLLAREFRDTAREYAEPDTSVICEHCWANVKMAEAIMGRSSNGR